jgi:hypothetical protein
VNEPIKHAIGHGRIADLFVPPDHGQLRRENERAYLIAVLANLPEELPGFSDRVDNCIA